MDQEEQIVRLQSLFRGNSRVIGQASNDLVPEEGGKLNQSIRGFASGPATNDHWQRHLDGQKSLGLVPITDYHECKFMAIDVDLDIMEACKVTLASIAASVEANGMPFVVCRSKSGAAHLYVFFKDMVKVAAVRNALSKMSDYLGFNASDRPCEYFPHTVKLDPDSNGKYINLPYFDSARTVRYAIDFSGNQLSLDDFIRLAENKSLSEKEFNGWKFPAQADETIRDVIVNGPPCLQTIYDQGLQDGTKNDMLFQFAILFKRYDANTFEDNVNIINNSRTTSPHDPSDLANTLKSLRKKNYHYSCSHPCMKSICAKGLCMTRKYGIVPQVEVPPIKRILQWGASDEYFEILFESGAKVKILCSSFIDFHAFRAALVQSLHLVIPEPKKMEWQEWIIAMMGKVERVEVPKEFNIEHSIRSLIVSYATGRTLGTKIEELLVNKPVKEGETIIMRQKDIQAEILKRRFPGYVNDLELSVVINELNGSMNVKMIEGHIVPVFIIPDPKINQENLVDKVFTEYETKY